jgi:hypothetical protein
MRRKAILGTLALVMALSLAIPFASVALADTERTSDTATDIRLALDIRAPAEVVVGQPVVMQVVEKHTGRVVAGAGIWAIDLNSVTIAAESAEAYAALAASSGQFLGQTNGRGLLRHSFDDAGRYVLVAVKDGFVPGFTRITINPRPLRALAVDAPAAARVGQPVVVTVTLANSQRPVAQAAVYAVNINDLASLAADAQDYAALVASNGQFLGMTNRNGQLRHSFSEVGKYVLVALKDGFVPGFAKISIERGPRPQVEARPITDIQPSAIRPDMEK